ncbi:hypothetical protein J6590_022957 [Homalodisca vitripennis]|nr:hypothetical protein J6590_022957 [Homalodisca vitripennis]
MQSPGVATAEPRCLPMPSPEPAANTLSGYTLDITPQQLRGGSEIFTYIRTLYSCC